MVTLDPACDLYPGTDPHHPSAHQQQGKIQNEEAGDLPGLRKILERIKVKTPSTQLRA